MSTPAVSLSARRRQVCPSERATPRGHVTGPERTRPSSNRVHTLPPTCASTCHSITVYREREKEVSCVLGEWLYTSQSIVTEGNVRMLHVHETCTFAAPSPWILAKTKTAGRHGNAKKITRSLTVQLSHSWTPSSRRIFRRTRPEQNGETDTQCWVTRFLPVTARRTFSQVYWHRLRVAGNSWQSVTDRRLPLLEPGHLRRIRAYATPRRGITPHYHPRWVRRRSRAVSSKSSPAHTDQL